MIARQTVDLILDTAQIADVVSDYVTLKRRGANYVACCPFHNEKTPSFYVSPAKGIYKCFGCGKSGTAVGFIMEQEHCSYTEALRYLARKYRIEIVEKEESPEEIMRRQRSESLVLVCEFALKFFKENLKTQEGKDLAMAYYHSRGIEDQSIERFDLGWAPSGRTRFVEAALTAGYKPEYLLAAGLAVQQEDGSLSDKFKERIIFPIHTVSGRVVAFSGRTLRSDISAKYLNSPETEIYSKSRNLLGIFAAKAEISRQNKCILVEGNMDMLMMHQLGISNVVASCGTALTVEQIRLIHKFTDNITIMYDGDSAGIHAALRGISLVLAEGMNVRIVLLPDGEDPDSFSKKHTLEQMQDFISSNEKDFIAFKTELLLKEAAGDPIRKAELINDIADTIASIPDAVKRSVYVEYTAQQFGIETSILFERITSTRRKAHEETLKERERQTRRSQSPENYSAPSQEMGDFNNFAPRNDNYTEENPVLAGAERDLLFFLLTHGRHDLDFETSSDFYSGDESSKVTVAEFIREALESDGTIMANSVYAEVYRLYFVHYDEGLAQGDIVKKLLDQSDRRVANAAAELSAERYQLSVKAFADSMTTTSSWLVSQVPKTIMLYAERRLQDRLNTLKKDLAQSDEEGQTQILKEMMRIQTAQRRINKKIGREKIKEQYG